ncbi:MAG: Lrp/AsnC family transcriptional regulator [Candidatus Bathyarchaeota archaeon]|nr:Lrp/AsnC family transcriptional regulator [Candidatus Bathyarchaeota archaeon]
MDKVDEEIIRLLKQDGRIALADISREVGLSSPTIKDRIGKLEAEGVILGYRPLLDYGKLGLGMTAFIGLTLDFHTCCQGDVDGALKSMGEVVEAHYTDGEWDMLIKVQAANPGGLMAFLQRLNAVPGITNSRTIISLANPIRSV